jgi:hypothetical protein|tara:strand:- start:210 stop:842 length:633 start_codon:yes stop_codon:yes gene_type:complete
MAVKASSGMITILEPNIQRKVFPIEGTAMYVQLRFSQKKIEELKDKQSQGKAAPKPKRDARNYEQEFEDSMYKSTEGWRGIPCQAIKAAMVRAASLTGALPMTQAKMLVSVHPDGHDAETGEQLVRIHGEPKLRTDHVRNATGVVDIRTRAQWDTGWTAEPIVEFDADLISLESVAALLMRAGLQVGIGEGRPSSKMSIGMGWGTFTSAK